MQKQDIPQKYEAIIIGAGAAGLGAAAIFHKHNLPYLVLEARMRIGGRVYSHLIDGVQIDVGACWIHSYNKNSNPMHKYVNKFGIQRGKLTKREFGRFYFDGQTGQPFQKHTLQLAKLSEQEYFNLAERNVKKTGHDLSIDEAARSDFEAKWQKMEAQEKRCAQMKINMTEHYEASSVQQLSTMHYEFRKDKGCDYLPAGTYAGLLRRISIDLNIALNKKVTHIERQKQKCHILCSDGSHYICKKLLVSLPLGVLKSGSVKIVPQLPLQHQHAIKHLGVGLMNKVIMSFSQNFWGSVYWISVGCNEKGKFPHFYNFSQKERHILCCFITDDFARKVQKMTDGEIVNELLLMLKNIFKNKKIQLRQAIVTHWGSDEFSMGSYTSFHVNSSPEDCKNLRKSIDDQMWIIGQHCYAEHIGTAHGAMNTGQWAAEEALDSLKWIKKKEEVKKQVKKESKKYITGSLKNMKNE